MYGMDLPTGLTKPDLTLLDANDTIPSNIDPSTISYLGEFSSAPLAFFLSNPNITVKWWDNGVAHSFQTRTIIGAIGDQGWVTVETVLIRLNTTYTPSGRFPVYSNESVPDANGVQTRIGYDAAVCVQKYEPWIIEAYNTTIGSPSALRIVDKVYDGTSSLPSGHIRGDPIVGTRNLNTTGKNPAFYVAHDNSINQMVKDNGRDFFYVPSPTVGPIVSSRLTSILTSTCCICSTGRFFYRRRRTRGVHRTITRSVRCYPRTGRCGQCPAIPCGVWTRGRTIIRGSDAGIRHLQAVATDRPPGACPDSGNHRRVVRADLTARHSTERIRGLQLAGAVTISGTWAVLYSISEAHQPLASRSCGLRWLMTSIS